MWQVLVAAAVAGSGLFARRLFNTNGDSSSTTNAASEQTSQCEHYEEQAHPLISAEPKVTIPCNLGGSDVFCSRKQGSVMGEDAIFRFSSTGSLNQTGVRSGGKKSRKWKGNVEGFKKGVEVRRLEKRFSVCLKKRRTGKSASTKCGSCCSKDGSFFGWGLGFGIMYMMSAGKAEISKLNTTVDETSRVVQELKVELYKRKSSRTMQVSSSVNKVDVSAVKIRGKHTQPICIKSTTENRVPNDVKDFILPLTEDGECASSVLTEEPAPEVLEMDQLEAELESELQKLPGCITEDCSHEGMRSAGSGKTEVLAKVCNESEGQTSDSYQFNGVMPSELNQKLCHLLIEQQEGQILELESELHVAQSKLHEKEAELQALKDCVRRLTEFSLSSVSDDEAEACVEQQASTTDWSNNNKMGLDSKKSVVGMKRAIDFESCGCQMR